jgi:hypothetical protein
VRIDWRIPTMMSGTIGCKLIDRLANELIIFGENSLSL